MGKEKGEMAKSGHSSFPLSPLLLSFVLGTMNPAAAGPALSEVEGTGAQQRDLFAKTMTLYACSVERSRHPGRTYLLLRLNLERGKLFLLHGVTQQSIGPLVLDGLLHPLRFRLYLIRRLAVNVAAESTRHVAPFCSERFAAGKPAGSAALPWNHREKSIAVQREEPVEARQITCINSRSVSYRYYHSYFRPYLQPAYLTMALGA